MFVRESLRQSTVSVKRISKRTSFAGNERLRVQPQT